MEERYTTIVKKDNNIYSEESPVVISASVLLKDNQNNSMIAQTKFLNLSEKTITALILHVVGKDITGEVVEENEDCRYMDIMAGPGTFFGHNIPITFKNTEVRNYVIRIKKIFFEDDTTWENNLSFWAPIPNQESITAVYENDLVIQYKKELGSKCEYKYMKYKDIWMCPCGNINKEKQEQCTACGLKLNKILYNTEAVLREKALIRKREEMEQKHWEESEAARKEADRIRFEKLEQQNKFKRKEKSNKTIITVLAIVAVLLITTLAFVYVKVIAPKNKYEKAREYMESGQYEKAEMIFKELGDYKDSIELYEEAFATKLLFSDWEGFMVVTEDYSYSASEIPFEIEISEDGTYSFEYADTVFSTGNWKYSSENKLLDEVSDILEEDCVVFDADSNEFSDDVYIYITKTGDKMLVIFDGGVIFSFVN